MRIWPKSYVVFFLRPARIVRSMNSYAPAHGRLPTRSKMILRLRFSDTCRIDTLFAATIDQLETLLPPEILRFLREQLNETLGGGQGGLLTVGVLGAIWSSSSAVTAIITALNRAYDIDEWRPWCSRRLIAIVITIARRAW